MRGAVSAGRLVNVPPVVTVTMTGTSPAPASEAGSVTMIWSKPGVCDGPTETMAVAGQVVAPMSDRAVRTVGVRRGEPRTPVSMMSSCVGHRLGRRRGAVAAAERAASSSR